MFKKLLLSILIAVLVSMLITMPILAILNPNVPPQVIAVYIYEDLLVDGDLGILIDYNLEYDPNPGIPATETVTESYLASFINTDGTTQIGTVSPYTFINVAYTDKGYERGMIWIYINAADVLTYNINKTNMALHKVWLMGNPTVPSGWTGDPPKTTAGIDEWWATGEGDHAVLLALRVLSFAEVLETEWGLDMIQTTALGSCLTSTGESYFENVIQNLRTIAPSCFSVSTVTQIQEDLDYSTAFGATIAEGTGTFPGAPPVLTEGANTVDIATTGTFVLELVKGTVGTAASIVGGATVTGGSVDLVAGINTINVTIGGTNDILITVNLVDTQTAITDTITGTALDLGVLYPGEVETLPEKFGMSTMMFSGLVWMLITVLICWATFRVRSQVGGQLGFGGGSGKTVMIVFDICIIGGAVLGLLDLLVAVLLFIAFGMLTGYVLFFRGASF